MCANHKINNPPHYFGANEPITNAAAMREALIAFVDSIQWLCDGDERGIFKRQFAPLLSDARAALAAPARNCDCTKDHAEEMFRERFGRPWTVKEDELATWLFQPVKKHDK